MVPRPNTRRRGKATTRCHGGPPQDHRPSFERLTPLTAGAPFGLPWLTMAQLTRLTITCHDCTWDGLDGQHEFVVFRASIVIGRALRSTVIGGWICICPFDEGRRGSQFLLGRLALDPKQAGSAAGLETDPHTRLSTQTSYNAQVGWLLCRRWSARDHALATHGKERGLWKPAPDI